MSSLAFKTEYEAAYPNLLEDRICSTNNLACNTAFIKTIEKCFNCNPLSVLDLGCFRGALVKGFLERGHFAVGFEQFRQEDGYWNELYGKNLYTCNVSENFSVCTSPGQIAQFDLVFGINLANLIPPERLPTFFANVRKHLKIGALFIGSISLEDHFPQNDEITRWQNYRLRMIEGLDFVNYSFDCIPYPIFRSFYYGLVRKF